VCALTEVTTGVFRLGEEAVKNMVGLYLDKKSSFLSESSLSSSRVLKPVPFIIHITRINCLYRMHNISFKNRGSFFSMMNFLAQLSVCVLTRHKSTATRRDL